MIVEVKGVMRCKAGIGRMVCSPYVGGRAPGWVWKESRVLWRGGGLMVIGGVDVDADADMLGLGSYDEVCGM